MGRQKTKEILDKIIKVLKNGPKSINEIASETGINWSTAEQNLGLLKTFNKVFEKDVKNKRVFFYKDIKNFFQLPIKEEHKKLIDGIYSEIKKQWNQIIKGDPPKTQVHKTIWKVNKKQNLGLPIGWYQYGPCCVEIYKNNHQGKIAPKIGTIIEETVKEYSKYNIFQLQKLVYEEADKKLYLAKEKFLEILCDEENKSGFNLVLMDLIRFSPEESKEVITDFSRCLLLFFDHIKELEEEIRATFSKIWKYIASVSFRVSLEEYYSKEYAIELLHSYLDEKIEENKKEAQFAILDLIRGRLKQHEVDKDVKELPKEEKKKIFEEFLKDKSDIFGKYNLN
ncbi:MAG: hypothetical protein KAT77_03725 [Nanoarchaeota archaeon]|nr:hypothetical protein [Nanoarchaeota archaeon]